MHEGRGVTADLMEVCEDPTLEWVQIHTSEGCTSARDRPIEDIFLLSSAAAE